MEGTEIVAWLFCFLQVTTVWKCEAESIQIYKEESKEIVCNTREIINIDKVETNSMELNKELCNGDKYTCYYSLIQNRCDGKNTCIIYGEDLSPVVCFWDPLDMGNISYRYPCNTGNGQMATITAYNDYRGMYGCRVLYFQLYYFRDEQFPLNVTSRCLSKALDTECGLFDTHDSSCIYLPFSVNVFYRCLPRSATTTPTPETTTAVHALSNLDSTGISIGQPTERHDVTCNANSMSVSIPSALIPYNHKVTWRDPHCLPLDNGTHYISTVSHQACGTTVRFTQESVMFENDLIILQPGASKGSSHDIINFGNTNTEVIPVQCIYPRHQNLTDAYRPAQKRIRFYEKRYGSMDVELEEYQTDQFLSIVPGTTYPREVSLNEDMYIKLRVIHNTSNVAIKVDSCVATSSVVPADGQVYQLLDHGCPASPAVKLYPSTVNEVKFGIRAFQFTSSPGNVVYIHCQVSVCSPRDPQCIVSCHGRRKRAAQESADDSSHLVSGGPYLLVSDEGSVQASTIVAAVCACVAVIAIVFGVIGWRRKSDESKTTL